MRDTETQHRSLKLVNVGICLFENDCLLGEIRRCRTLGPDRLSALKAEPEFRENQLTLITCPD